MLFSINLFDYTTKATERTINNLNSFIYYIWNIKIFFDFSFLSST